MKLFDKYIDKTTATNTHSGTVEAYATALEAKFAPNSPTTLDIINHVEASLKPLINPTNAE